MAEQLYTIQVSDYIPCFRKYAHDCLIEKGTFESPIPFSDIYYEE